MGARGYGISLRVFNYVAHEWAQRMSEISSWTRGEKFHIHKHVLFCFSYKLDKPFTDKKNQLYSLVIFDILKDQKRVESYRVKSRCIESCWSLPWNKTLKNHGIGWPHYWGKFRNVGKNFHLIFIIFVVTLSAARSIILSVNNFISVLFFFRVTLS